MEYNRPDPEGGIRAPEGGIRAPMLPWHNCYYYSLISTYMGPALPHITLLPLSCHRNLPQLAALLLTAEQPR